jgi:GNAT superfamily N-acetyltransferase
MTMMQVSTLEESQIRLPNGRHVRLRELRPGEYGPVRELCARLSLRTRYQRFLSPMPVVPDSLVRVLADSEGPRQLAVVAQLGTADESDVIALGNLCVADDDRAELGLVVADAWQRQGLGLALAATLVRAAEGRGHRRFVVHGLTGNPALRPLLRHLAEVVSTRTSYGVSEITFVSRHGAAESSVARLLLKRVGNDPQEQACERILASQGARSRVRS